MQRQKRVTLIVVFRNRFRNRRDVVMSGPIKAATGLDRQSHRTLTCCSRLSGNRYSNSFPCTLTPRLARTPLDLNCARLRLAI